MCCCYMLGLWQAWKTPHFRTRHRRGHGTRPRASTCIRDICVVWKLHRSPYAAENIKSSAHLVNLMGAVVQTILLRPSETPVYARCWAMSACIYAAFFSVCEVRL